MGAARGDSDKGILVVDTGEEGGAEEVIEKCLEFGA